MATYSLLDVPVNSTCAVDAVDGKSDFAARLAGLGLSVGRAVRMVKRGEPMIVQVYGTRIGLARSLAERVRVSLDHQDD